MCVSCPWLALFSNQNATSLPLYSQCTCIVLCCCMQLAPAEHRIAAPEPADRQFSGCGCISNYRSYARYIVVSAAHRAHAPTGSRQAELAVCAGLSESALVARQGDRHGGSSKDTSEKATVRRVHCFDYCKYIGLGVPSYVGSSPRWRLLQLYCLVWTHFAAAVYDSTWTIHDYPFQEEILAYALRVHTGD